MSGTSAINEARLVDFVRRSIKSSVNGFVHPANQQAILYTVQVLLSTMVHQDHILSFHDLEVGRVKPLKEVNDLPLTAKPGDPVIIDGIVETYEGLVVSSDGTGNGVVFSLSRDEDEMSISVKIQASYPSYPFQYIQLEVTV